MAFWNRRRSIDVMTAPHDGPRLKPTLSWPHLLALGVGAIVGTGMSLVQIADSWAAEGQQALGRL